MRLPDELLETYYRLVVEQEPPRGDPLQAKLALARFIVGRAHGPEAATQAEQHFTRVVRKGEPPADVPEGQLPGGDPVHLPALLVEHFGVGSTSEARRLISQGGVKIDGRAATGIDVSCLRCPQGRCKTSP
jgi:tyrosyl-tRNA synthetase